MLADEDAVDDDDEVDNDDLNLLSKADDNNWEGVMLRKNVQYKGKRSKDLLKVENIFEIYEVWKI